MSYLNSNVTFKGFYVSRKEGSIITAASIRDSISILQKHGQCQYDRYCKWKNTLALLHVNPFGGAPGPFRHFVSIANTACLDTHVPS